MSKKLRILPVLPLLVVLSACAGTGNTAGSYKLVSTVTRYHKDAESNEWTEYSREEYRYENSYPVSRTRYESGVEQPNEYSSYYIATGGSA